MNKEKFCKCLEILKCCISGNERKCRFDHHGGCQEHGFIFLELGEECPISEAFEFIEANRDTKEISEGE